MKFYRQLAVFLIASGLIVGVTSGLPKPPIYSPTPTQASPITYAIPAQIQPIVQDLGIDPAFLSQAEVIVGDTSLCGPSDLKDEAACSVSSTPFKIIIPESTIQLPYYQHNALFAHEYLHYVWDTMSVADQNALLPYIDEVYKANATYLNERLSGYTLTDVQRS